MRARVPSRHVSKTPAKAVNAVFLVGFMGAGKTSVGRELGQRLNWIFEDLDDRIVEREGRAIADIFRDSGEKEFRRAEHAALTEMLNEMHASSRIVALGGGAFAQPKNADLLQSSGVPTVFLDAAPDELWQRCSSQAAEAGTERPLLQSPKQFRKLYEERRPAYAKASIRIKTGNRSVDEIATEVIKKLRLKKIEIRVEEGETE